MQQEREGRYNYKTEKKHLLSNYVVAPYIENDRQKLQSGCFVLFGLYDEFREENQNNNEIDDVIDDVKVACIRIKKDNKSKILKELDMVGINKVTIFGDMEKTSEY